jgi:hypothetical protein
MHFLIVSSFSTKEALHLNDLYSSHNRVDFDPITLPYEDDSQVQTQTLRKFIEKTVEYLRWKVDRWRHDNIEVNQHDIVNLKLEKRNYGVQSAENAYNIWKHKDK